MRAFLADLFCWLDALLFHYSLVACGPRGEVQWDVCYKGESLPKPPKPPKIPKTPPPIIILPPEAPPPPPNIQNLAEIDQAREDAKRRIARQKGIGSTLLAGETGGYKPMTPAVDGPKSLLG